MKSTIHRIVVEIPMNVRELADMMGLSVDDVRAAVTEMHAQGLLKTDGQGRYVPNGEVKQ